MKHLAPSSGQKVAEQDGECCSQASPCNHTLKHQWWAKRTGLWQEMHVSSPALAPVRLYKVQNCAVTPHNHPFNYSFNHRLDHSSSLLTTTKGRMSTQKLVKMEG